jgi:hypothetical protein
MALKVINYAGITYTAVVCQTSLLFMPPCPLQVVPTVGMGGDDGEKKNATMLKHFRNLMDETASKQRFLAPFHRYGV